MVAVALRSVIAVLVALCFSVLFVFACCFVCFTAVWLLNAVELFFSVLMILLVMCTYRTPYLFSCIIDSSDA